MIGINLKKQNWVSLKTQDGAILFLHLPICYPLRVCCAWHRTNSPISDSLFDFLPLSGIRLFLKMASLAVESYWFLLVILASSAGASGKPIHKEAYEKICTFRPSAKTDFLTATLALVQQLGRNNVLRRQLENIQSVTPFPIIRYACAACPSLVSRDLCRTTPGEDESRERVQSPASNGSATERTFTHSSLTEAVTKAYSLDQDGKELQLRRICAWAYLRPECTFNPTIFPPIICQPKCNHPEFTCPCGNECSVSNPLYRREVTILETTGCNRSGQVRWIATSRNLLLLQYDVCGCQSNSPWP